MTKIVLRAAHFEICPHCNLHGRIIFSNCTASKELKTIDEALAEIDGAIEEGQLIDVEVESLRKQILDSPLPLVRIAEMIAVCADGTVEQCFPDRESELCIINTIGPN